MPRHLPVAAALLVAALPALAAGLDISFHEQPPALPRHLPVMVEAGVEPGVPVLFDLSRRDRITLRAATDGETPGPGPSLYRFEWVDRDSARFYRITPASWIAERTAANERDAASPDGKRFEQGVLGQYLEQGRALAACVVAANPPRGPLSIFVVIASDGRLDSAVVQPEGTAAACILERGKGQVLTPPPGGREFTAHALIQLR